MTKVLNLSEGFTPYATSPYSEVEYEYFTFKGGEPHFKLTSPLGYNDTLIITIRINSFNDLGKLLVAHDAISRGEQGEPEDMKLVLPYFPGARQDRVMTPGEPLTVKVYANIINKLEFNLVEIIDPHSDVTPALLDNVEVITNHGFIEKILEDNYRGTIIVVSPDAGSNKKIKDLIKHLIVQFPNKKFEIVKCDKTRDVATGEITGFEIYNTPYFKAGASILIVDDICDGGGTFIGLAEELRKYTKLPLHLCVTHGIFSKGFKELNKYYDTIYTTNSIKNYDSNFIKDHKHHLGFKPNVKQIKIVDTW